MSGRMSASDRYTQNPDGSYSRSSGRTTQQVAAEGYDSWSKADLENELEGRGLTKTGSKDELLARLQEDDKQSA